MLFSGDEIGYVNGMDVKLMQREWGKYLSNACLFPPNCFTDELYDFDKFSYITEGNHDELWFWIVSTLNGVQCIGLNNTFSYQLDEGVTFEHDSGALSHINANPDTIAGYNARLNEVFGKQMIAQIEAKPIVFNVSKDNVLAFCALARGIYKLYGRYRIEVHCDETIVASWIMHIRQSFSSMTWREVKIKVK